MEKFTPDGYVYIKVRKGMYGLPITGLIAQELLEKRLNNFRSAKCTTRAIQATIYQKPFFQKSTQRILGSCQRSSRCRNGRPSQLPSTATSSNIKCQLELLRSKKNWSPCSRGRRATRESNQHNILYKERRRVKR